MKADVFVQLVPAGEWLPGTLTTDHPACRYKLPVVLIGEKVYEPHDTWCIRALADTPIELVDRAVEAGYYIVGQQPRGSVIRGHSPRPAGSIGRGRPVRACMKGTGMGLSELRKVLCMSQTDLDQMFASLNELDTELDGDSGPSFAVTLEKSLKDGDIRKFQHYAMLLASAMDMIIRHQLTERMVDAAETGKNGTPPSDETADLPPEG